MYFQLVSHWFNFAAFKNNIQMMRKEIAKTYSPCLLFLVYFFKSLPGLHDEFRPSFVIMSWFWPVDNVQIHIIHLKSFKGTVKSLLCFMVSQFIAPSLCSNKKLLPGNTTVFYGISNVFLIFIFGGSVKVSVTAINGQLYRSIVCFVCPKPYAGYHYSVIELNVMHISTHPFLLGVLYTKYCLRQCFMLD